MALSQQTSESFKDLSKDEKTKSRVEKIDISDYERILRELYFKLNNIIPFYQIILKEKYWEFKLCFIENKKVILFDKIQK